MDVISSLDPSQEPLPTEGAASQTTPGIEVQVSPDTTFRLDVSNAKTKESADITLPYVIYNLATHTPIYIPKGTIVAYADEDKPEMDCSEIAETYKEAQEVIEQELFTISTYTASASQV